MLYLNKVTYGRPLTSSENTQVNNYLFGDPVVGDRAMFISLSMIYDETGTYPDEYIYAFNNQTALDGYVALVESFTPAPIKVRSLS